MAILSHAEMVTFYRGNHSAHSLRILRNSYRDRGEGYTAELKAIEEALADLEAVPANQYNGAGLKAALCIVMMILLAFTGVAQTDTLYKGVRYPFETGPKGGIYFTDNEGVRHPKHKPRVSKWVDMGDYAVHKDTGERLPINVGPRGGRYIVVNGRKEYFPRTI